eukprot:3489749-Prymnesium_polylepis.1
MYHHPSGTAVTPFLPTEPHADPTRHRSNAMGPAGVCAHAGVRWHACVGGVRVARLARLLGGGSPAIGRKHKSSRFCLSRCHNHPPVTQQPTRYTSTPTLPHVCSIGVVLTHKRSVNRVPTHFCWAGLVCRQPLHPVRNRAHASCTMQLAAST